MCSTSPPLVCQVCQSLAPCLLCLQLKAGPVWPWPATAGDCGSSWLRTQRAVGGRRPRAARLSWCKGKLPRLPGTASGSCSVPAGWRSPPRPSAVPVWPPASPAGMAPGTGGEESASVTSCSSPDGQEIFDPLRLSSSRRSSRRKRRCNETGSGSAREGPAAGTAHQSVATENQNGMGWTQLEPARWSTRVCLYQWNATLQWRSQLVQAEPSCSPTNHAKDRMSS